MLFVIVGVIAFKPVLGTAGFGKIGEINKTYLSLSSVVLLLSIFVLYQSYCLLMANKREY